MRRLLLVLAVLLPLVVFAGSLQDANWPRLTILPLATTPAIDGKVSAGEWDAAVTLPGLTRLGQAALVGNQPLVRVAYTPSALLVCAQVPLPPGERARATATDFDGTVWNDDSIEVHLDHGHQHQKNYQFVVNALGTHFDSLGGDPKWNGQWEARADNAPGRWSAEFAIPWSTVGGAPQPGATDGFNVIINSSYLGGTLSFSPLKSSAHDTANYAHLTYGQAAAVSVEGLDGAKLDAFTVRGLGQGEATFDYTLTRAEEKTPLSKQSVRVPAGAAVAVPLPLPADAGLLKTGTYNLALRATAAGTPVLVRAVSLTVDEPLLIELHAFTRERHLDLLLRPQQAVFADADTTYDITVAGPRGVIRHEQVQRKGTGGADLVLADKELPQGKLTVKVVATNRKTGLARTVERELAENPLHPVWLGTSEGLTDKVPAPWTPMTLDAKTHTVQCWGRAYAFDKGPLPAQVKTRGATVLARPITFRGRVEGQALLWTSGSNRTADMAPNHITIEGHANSGAATAPTIKLDGTARVEYDGMVRVDLMLTPRREGAVCQELTLEIPLNTDNARYLYHFPGRWGSVANDGFVPKGGFSHAFKPFVWLGDEDRGFSWFCESDENWFPSGNPRALTVDVDGPITYLRCHLIATDTKLDKPLRYTFGFQATPVKQPEKTVWDYRITHHGNYGLENQKSVTGGKITYPAAGHIRKEEGTFECWYRPAVDSERDKAFAQRTYPGNRDLFTVQLSPGMNGSNYGLYYNGTVQGLVAWARTDGAVTLNPQSHFDWKAGEWHHVAMTWDPQVVRMYLDGKVISETPNKGFLAAPLDKAQIIIGGDGALATIDDVRILAVARPPVVTDKPFESDAQTLLLDHFEGYGGKAQAAGTPDTPVGQADAWVKFAPGKFGQAPTWEPQLGRARLAELYDAGVRTICFHEHWVPYQSYPHVTDADRPRLRSLADAMKANKLNLLLYMSRQFADNSPEWELYNNEACEEPRPAPYTRYPQQKDYIACWNGPYKDFALYWLGKTMDEFGNAGWYLDGPEWPMACANRSHGCGYVAPDGTIRPTWDIFATREFMRRLYVLTRNRNPEGQLNIHNSTVMVIPTLGWGTSTWSGEQIDAIKPPVKTLDILPMDAFRTEFMGRQWGVPAEFLVYDGSPYYAKDVLAYTLLHGVPIRPGSPDSIERLSALWKAHDEFPFSHGEMLGYWNNADYIKVDPQGVYATIWRLPQKGALIVVSNLTDADAQAQVTLNLGKLASGSQLSDALTGEALTHGNGKLTLPVASWRYRVLRVKP